MSPVSCPGFRLERPSLDRAGEFLDAVNRSKVLHSCFVEPPTSMAAIRAYIARKNSGLDIGHFIICPHQNALAGVINLNDISAGVATLGYYAFAPYQGKGIMRSALREVARLAFDEYSLRRLEANIQPDNNASIAMAISNGFRYCSYHPRFMQLAGRLRDHQRWVLTLADWRAALDPIRIRA